MDKTEQQLSDLYDRVKNRRKCVTQKREIIDLNSSPQNKRQKLIRTSTSKKSKSASSIQKSKQKVSLHKAQRNTSTCTSKCLFSSDSASENLDISRGEDNSDADEVIFCPNTPPSSSATQLNTSLPASFGPNLTISSHPKTQSLSSSQNSEKSETNSSSEVEFVSSSFMRITDHAVEDLNDLLHVDIKKSPDASPKHETAEVKTEFQVKIEPESPVQKTKIESTENLTNAPAHHILLQLQNSKDNKNTPTLPEKIINQTQASPATFLTSEEKISTIEKITSENYDTISRTGKMLENYLEADEMLKNLRKLQTKLETETANFQKLKNSKILTILLQPSSHQKKLIKQLFQYQKLQEDYIKKIEEAKNCKKSKNKDKKSTDTCKLLKDGDTDDDEATSDDSNTSISAKIPKLPIIVDKTTKKKIKKLEDDKIILISQIKKLKKSSKTEEKRHAVILKEYSEKIKKLEGKVDKLHSERLNWGVGFEFFGSSRTRVCCTVFKKVPKKSPKRAQ